MCRYESSIQVAFFAMIYWEKKHSWSFLSAIACYGTARLLGLHIAFYIHLEREMN
jgi:hypothetical protein